MAAAEVVADLGAETPVLDILRLKDWRGAGRIGQRRGERNTHLLDLLHRFLATPLQGWFMARDFFLLPNALALGEINVHNSPRRG